MFYTTIGYFLLIFFDLGLSLLEDFVSDFLSSTKFGLLNSEIIISTIENVEKTCEFYVERRMNRSINSMIAGKGIDDIL